MLAALRQLRTSWRTTVIIAHEHHVVWYIFQRHPGSEEVFQDFFRRLSPSFSETIQLLVLFFSFFWSIGITFFITQKILSAQCSLSFIYSLLRSTLSPLYSIHARPRSYFTCSTSTLPLALYPCTPTILPSTFIHPAIHYLACNFKPQSSILYLVVCNLSPPH